jgi:hypothetical protein
MAKPRSHVPPASGLQAKLPDLSIYPNSGSTFPQVPRYDEEEARIAQICRFRGIRTLQGVRSLRLPKAQRARCTSGDYRRISRWEHEEVLETVQKRLDRTPHASRLRRQTVEHPFGTLKAWMGATHFLTKTLPRVSTEMSLHVLAYNLKRLMQILGAQRVIRAMRT